MMPTQKSLHERFAKHMPKAHLDQLAEIGLDIVIERAQGKYLYDHDGGEYLDCYSSAGVFNLGRHPGDVAEHLRAALNETDQGNFPMISREKAALAERLAGWMSLGSVVFGVGRGEAFDAACKIARGFTGRQALVAPDGSCFGQTGFALSLSERMDPGLFGPLVPDTHILPYGNVEALQRHVGRQTAAVLIEPMQVEAHCRTEPAYLEAIQRRCRETGALLVVDETQTGFGRTGRRFAYEAMGLQPDVVVLGESLGGGMFPITAAVFSARVGSFMNSHPLIHLSTFGGSDLGCRVALGALDSYERLHPWDNASAMGQLLQSELRRSVGAAVISTAGKGLVVSLELSSPTRARRFCKLLAAQRVLATPAAIARHCVLLRPSLLLEAPDIERIVEAVKRAAEALA